MGVGKVIQVIMSPKHYIIGQPSLKIISQLWLLLLAKTHTTASCVEVLCLTHSITCNFVPQRFPGVDIETCVQSTVGPRVLEFILTKSPKICA